MKIGNFFKALGPGLLVVQVMMTLQRLLHTPQAKAKKESVKMQWKNKNR